MEISKKSSEVMTRTGCDTEIVKSYGKDEKDNSPGLGSLFHCSLTKTKPGLLLKGTTQNKERVLLIYISCWLWRILYGQTGLHWLLMHVSMIVQ